MGNEMVKKMQGRWAEELKRRERKVLSVIFDRVEMGDDEEGLSFEEFQEFKGHLPITYQLRMAKLGTWLEIAGDDGVLQFDEFQELMDNFVDQVVGDLQGLELEKWEEQDIVELALDS